MKKVLFIEDDDIIRRNVEEILKLAHYEVITASDGKEGSELAIKHQPDIVVCDILMPQLDGFGVLYVLSKNKETENIPFIFLSAKSQKSDIRKGMELGADDYLCKPFDSNELLVAIDARLKKNEKFHKKVQNNYGITEIANAEESLKIMELLDSIQNKHLTTFETKEVVYHTDDIPQNIYIIKKGRIKTYKTNKEGKEYITKIYKEGDIFGHTAVFSNTNYIDSAKTLQESEIYKMTKADFLHVLSSDFRFVNIFIQLLSGDINNYEKQLLSLAYDSVRKRTAEAILLLLEPQDSRSEDQMVVSVNRDDLAALAGTAVETAIRCLSEFKEDGIISSKGREIIVLDKGALQMV